MQMIANDRLEKERANAKNAVEEYVYEMRDKLYTEYEPYVKEDVSTNMAVINPRLTDMLICNTPPLYSYLSQFPRIVPNL